MSTTLAKLKTKFSKDRLYRYLLVREIAPTATPRVLGAIGLNPSKANEVENDPTVTRWLSLARREQCSHLLVGNLFAIRSTDRTGVLQCSDPVGADNDYWLLALAQQSHILLASWGADKAVQRFGRDQTVLELLRRYHIWCLGRTSQGHPKHPLYLRSDTPLELYRRPLQRSR